MLVGNFPIPPGAEQDKRAPTEKAAAEAKPLHGDLSQALFCERCQHHPSNVGPLKWMEVATKLMILCAACWREMQGLI